MNIYITLLLKKKAISFFRVYVCFLYRYVLISFFQRIFCVGNWLFDCNAEDQKLRITDCASEVNSLLLFLKHYFFERWKGWEMAPWRIVQKNETATEEKYELIALISIRIPYSIFIRLHSWLYCAIEDSWLFIQTWLGFRNLICTWVSYVAKNENVISKVVNSVNDS